MRVLTYPSPFELRNNSELWNVITTNPHFCASDTLVQGLESEYGRYSFGILRTINVLIECVMGKYTDNVLNDVQMFLTISNIIRGICDKDIETAFRFNIADVVEAVKFLIMLECDSKEFKGYQTEEQKILLDIYDKIIQTDLLDPLNELKKMDKDDFIMSASTTINDEIAYLFNRSEYASLDISYPLKTLKDGYAAIQRIIRYLNEKSQLAPNDILSPLSFSDDLDKAKHISRLITNTNDSTFNSIIIHGVHKITPTMYFLFNLLEKIGVEVIFLINYAKNLPRIYKTWEEVYSWCVCPADFEFCKQVDMSSGNKLGAAIAGIVEGWKTPVVSNEKIIVFNNLTSFTDHEVRKTFKSCGEQLNKMQTQYYAVHGDSSNEILKMYFPKQFNQKPFLSYPIGQFILGVYQMWDFKKNTLLLNDRSLSECAVSRLYKGKDDLNILEIINKTKLYFSDIELLKDYYARIKVLETAIQIINHNKRYISLKKLSFFSLTTAEVEEFRCFIEFIEGIATSLFEDSSSAIDFGKHFKTLIDIISLPMVDRNILSTSEQELITEVTKKLDSFKGNVIGSVEDVKEALRFFLAAKKKNDTSTWIVRDFEQIDGAVLLRKVSKAKYYHFTLLSNAHMTNQNDDVLVWPLTDEMFMGYADKQSAVPVITKGLLERRNFLKYSLFYGTFFTKCGIKLSYINEENGEEQTPYYLFKVLGIEDDKYHEKENTSFLTDDEGDAGGKNFRSSLDREARELFSVCPYKFLQNQVLKTPIEYYSDYHIKYFVSNFMFNFIKANHPRYEILKKVVTEEFHHVKKLFPFWGEAVLLDIQKNVEKMLKSSPHIAQENYQIRKENFLIAQWEDHKTGQKEMVFDKAGLSDMIAQYMVSSQLYPSQNELPHKKVCENCNFGEICLRDYYEARASSEVEKEVI